MDILRLSVILILFFLFIGFVIWFVIPALRQYFILQSLLRKLESMDTKKSSDPHALDSVFADDERIHHLWREYKKTFYQTPTGVETGVATSRWYSTVPAEAVLSAQKVVDQKVHAEFFKHLPGIFTGVGIIGTFLGLIDGLGRFQVSSDADIVRVSLESLMHSVSEAFVISAIAITLAIVVTLLEKYILSKLYSKVNDIAFNINRRFPAAVAERFLQEVAAHTEESATQLKHLKGEIIKEINPILQELSDRHTQMLKHLAGTLQDRLTENTHALGKTISEAITISFTGPLDDIKRAVQQASGDQSDTAIRMLQDVMTSFSQRLNDLFGGQISGINEINQRTAQTMQDAVQKLNELIVSLQEAGKKSSDAMAEQMARVITEIDERQNRINERTQKFVEQIEAFIASSQEETKDRMQSTLQMLGERMSVLLADIQDTQGAILEERRQREEETAARVQTTVSDLADSVQALIGELASTFAGMQESITALRETTMAAIVGLNEGAEQVGAAVRNFSNASDKVSGVMSQAAATTANLIDLGASLRASASVLQQGLHDYQVHREAMGRLVEELNALVENAKRDVSITSDVLQHIEAATRALADAHKQTEKFMDGVSDVLAKAYESFSENVTRSLDRSNYEFQERLSKAVGLLHGTIQELEEVVNTMSVLGRGRRS